MLAKTGRNKPEVARAVETPLGKSYAPAAPKIADESPEARLSVRTRSRLGVGGGRTLCILDEQAVTGM